MQGRGGGNVRSRGRECLVERANMQGRAGRICSGERAGMFGRGGGNVRSRGRERSVEGAGMFGRGMVGRAGAIVPTSDRRYSALTGRRCPFEQAGINRRAGVDLPPSPGIRAETSITARNADRNRALGDVSAQSRGARQRAAPGPATRDRARADAAGARLGSGRALRYHDAELGGIRGARSCGNCVRPRPGSVAQGGAAAGSSLEARSAYTPFDPSPVEDSAHRRTDDSTDRGVALRRGHGSAARRRCQVRRVRRHGRAPFVVVGSAGRRRRRSGTHVHPRPERLANVREERCRLVRHPAAVARGDRGDRLRTHDLGLNVVPPCAETSPRGPVLSACRALIDVSVRGARARRYSCDDSIRHLRLAGVTVTPAAGSSRPLERDICARSACICARSTEHLRPVGRNLRPLGTAFAPARPDICARSTRHVRPSGGRVSGGRGRAAHRARPRPSSRYPRRPGPRRAARGAACATRTSPSGR